MSKDIIYLLMVEFDSREARNKAITTMELSGENGPTVCTFNMEHETVRKFIDEMFEEVSK